MNFIRTKIPDIIILEPKIFSDDRGYFSETFNQFELQKFVEFPVNFVQDNESKSSFGVIRALHYQSPPFPQSKLVRVTRGRVLDVAVDLRVNSPTFKHHVSIELTENNNKQLFIPRGFAHGFVVLSDVAIFNYKVDNCYDKNSERGIAFNDSALGIDWVVKKELLKLSSKDQNQPLFKNAEHFHDLENLYI